MMTFQQHVGTVAVLVVLTAACAHAEPPSPPVLILLGPRHAKAAPERVGFTHTGAGNIDVAQPVADTVIITMTGAAMAGPHPCTDSSASIPFELEQALEVTVVDPKVRQARLSMEARIAGLLRSHSAYHCPNATGSAEISAAQATLFLGEREIVSARLKEHAVSGIDLAINDHAGPLETAIVPAKYTLRASFAITAAHPRRALPAASASTEFAPESALDPLWLGLRDPFHGAVKKNYGFQVTIKVIAGP